MQDEPQLYIISVVNCVHFQTLSNPDIPFPITRMRPGYGVKLHPPPVVKVAHMNIPVVSAQQVVKVDPKRVFFVLSFSYRSFY